jgi:hypothetical protein
MIKGRIRPFNDAIEISEGKGFVNGTECRLQPAKGGPQLGDELQIVHPQVTTEGAASLQTPSCRHGVQQR